MFVSLGIYYYLAEQRCKGGYLLRNAICTSVFWLAVDFLLYMGDMASVFVYSIFILGQGEGPRWIKEMEHSLYGPTYMFFFFFFFLLNQGVQALGPNPPLGLEPVFVCTITALDTLSRPRLELVTSKTGA